MHVLFSFDQSSGVYIMVLVHSGESAWWSTSCAKLQFLPSNLATLFIYLPILLNPQQYFALVLRRQSTFGRERKPVPRHPQDIVVWFATHLIIWILLGNHHNQGVDNDRDSEIIAHLDEKSDCSSQFIIMQQRAHIQNLRCFRDQVRLLDSTLF